VNYGLLEPLVNDATDADLWGNYLNTTISELDTLVFTAMSFTPSAQTSVITVAAPTTGSTSTGNARTLFTCDASGGAFAANLPSASISSGMIVAFKKLDGSANAITITGNGVDLIDGSNTYPLLQQYQWGILSCDGTHWNVISAGPPASITTLPNGTVATTQALNNSTTLVATTAFANPTNVLGPNSGQPFPSGFILQSGVTASIAPGGTYTGAFPIPFSIACNAIVASGTNSAAAGPVAANFISTTQFTIKNQSAQNQAFYWMATGR
jgi:hypothetical protein